LEEKMVYVGQKKFHYLLPLSMGASCLLLTSGAMAADTQMLQPAIEQSLLQHPHVAEANAPSWVEQGASAAANLIIG
jgi:hypothetical protein